MITSSTLENDNIQAFNNDYIYIMRNNNILVSHLLCKHFYRLLSSRCDMEKGGGKGKDTGLITERG